MPVGEVIFGFIAEVISYIIFELIIEGIGRLFRKIYYWVRKLLTGKERETPELELIENRYLLKKVIVISDLHELLPKGTRGIVMEVINEHSFYVEFEDSYGKPILVNGEKRMKINRSKVMLESNRRTHNTVYSK